MFIYLIINIIIFIFALLFENTFFSIKDKKQISNIIYISVCCVLIVLSSCRYKIGVDYDVYYQRYISGYRDGSSLTIFKWLFKVFYFFNVPYQAIIIICSLLFLIPFFYLIYKYQNSYKFYAIGILMGFMYYINSYNIFRQYAAMGMLIGCAYLYSKKRKWRWLVGMFISVSIHPLISIALLIYLVMYIWKPSLKTIRLFQVIGFIAYFIITDQQSEQIVRGIASFIFLKIPTYSHYVLSPDQQFIRAVYTQSLEFIPKVMFIPCMILLPIGINTFYKHEQCKEKSLNRSYFFYWFTKIYFFYFFIMAFHFGSELVSRFLQFFSIIGVIVIPETFYHFGKNKILLSTFKLFIIVICIYTELRCINKMAVGAYPYQSILSLL